MPVPRALLVRRLLLALAFVGLLVAGLATAPAASALADAVTVAGSVAPAPGSTPEVTVSFTIDAAGGPIGDARLAATDPAGLVADAGSVTVDGAAAPAETVDTTPDGLLIRAGTGASPQAGGVLADGSHTVSYTADATGATAGASVSAELSYRDASQQPQTAASGPVAVPLPDLSVSLPPVLNEDRLLPITPGREGFFGVDLRDTGAAVDAGVLTVTLPTGLQLDPRFGVQRIRPGANSPDHLSCLPPAAGTTACELGAVGSGMQQVAFVVRDTGAAPAGSTAAFTVGARAASGLEATPDDNQVTAHVRFVGAPQLTLRLHTDRHRVPAGTSAHVRVDVHNVGDGPATLPAGILGVGLRRPTGKRHFRITHFTGALLQPGGGSSVGGSRAGGGSEAAALASAAPPSMKQLVARAVRLQRARIAQPQLVLWNVPRLPAGGRTSATLTLRAQHPGRSTVDAIVIDPGDPGACFTPACRNADSLTLTAVAAPPTPQSGADQPIAETGVPALPLSGLGMLLVLLGGVLLRAAAARRGVRHRA